MLLLYVIGCSGSSHKEDGLVLGRPSLKITENQKVKTYDIQRQIDTTIFNCIDSVKLVRLETTPVSIIGSIGKIAVVNDTLFVCDYTKSNSIFAFNMNGEFLYKINSIGKGPGEYQSLNSAHINNKEIIISDWLSGKVIRYDLKGGLIDEQRFLPSSLDAITNAEGKYLLAFNSYTETKPFRLEFFDGQVKKETAFPFANSRSFTLSSAFQRVGKDILFHYPWCDTVYKVNGTGIKPEYVLSLYRPNEISDLIKNNTDLNDQEFNKKISFDSGLPIFENFLELKDFLYVNITKNRKSYISLISKTNDSVKTYVQADIEHMKFDLPFHITGFYENSLLMSIDQSFILQLPKNDQIAFQNRLNNSKYTAWLKELEDTGKNPLICIVKLKHTL